MTKDKAQAEAEKIIHLYRDHVAIDYQYDEEPLRSCQIECAIIHVKGTIEEIKFSRDYIPEYFWKTRNKHWQSILTELEMVSEK